MRRLALGRPSRGWRCSAGALAMVLSLGACDWAMFGADAGRTRSYPEDVVASADRAAMSTLFRAPTGGDVVSSPAVAGGVVYVGSDDHRLYAVDAAGTIDCGNTPRTCTPPFSADVGDVAESSPAVANGMVYVGGAGTRAFRLP